jgi:hypothetical protein
MSSIDVKSNTDVKSLSQRKVNQKNPHKDRTVSFSSRVTLTFLLYLGHSEDHLDRSIA